MVDVWKCAKSGHILEIDDEQTPDCRLEVKLEGHSCQGKLHLSEEQYLHCRFCEARGECTICNLEPRVALEYESL